MNQVVNQAVNLVLYPVDNLVINQVHNRLVNQQFNLVRRYLLISFTSSSLPLTRSSRYYRSQHRNQVVNQRRNQVSKQVVNRHRIQRVNRLLDLQRNPVRR